MNKLPTKQIYLLAIIIIGIIALSVYSTYAIFTLESETSDIVSIQTVSNLSISSTTYEYKQITVPKNSNITTDIDIYNNFNYELCYSIWYKVVSSKETNTNKVKVYQNTDSSLTTSGSLNTVTSRRIKLIITNDNDKDVKVNIGVSHSKNEGTCELNISKDKLLILSSINNLELLSDTLIKNIETKNDTSNYLTYKNDTEEITLPTNTNIYVSNKFTYEDEIFTLTDSIEIKSNEIEKYLSNDNTNYYICIDNKECRYLYRITEVKKEQSSYKLTRYDTFVGYLSGNSGLRKVDQNYYYYGDNPNNFIYYNCTNELDSKTCELWRIIGIFFDSKDNSYITKIIRNNSIGTYEYNKLNNSWNNSTISKYLSEEYKLNNANTIKEMNFKVENITNLDINLNEINFLNQSNNVEIMLMNLSDYLNTSICQNRKISEYDEICLNSNWLNKNYSLNEWTMTIKYENQYVDEETKETINPANNTVYSVGSSIESSLSTAKLNVRPVIYLKKSTILNTGNGTFDNPYMIR